MCAMQALQLPRLAQEGWNDGGLEGALSSVTRQGVSSGKQSDQAP